MEEGGESKKRPRKKFEERGANWYSRCPFTGSIRQGMWGGEKGWHGEGRRGKREKEPNKHVVEGLSAGANRGWGGPDRNCKEGGWTGRGKGGGWKNAAGTLCWAIRFAKNW